MVIYNAGALGVLAFIRAGLGFEHNLSKHSKLLVTEALKLVGRDGEEIRQELVVGSLEKDWLTDI